MKVIAYNRSPREDEDNPLYTLENVILTPHIGWRGFETRQRLVSIVADDIRSYFANNPINVVN